MVEHDHESRFPQVVGVDGGAGILRSQAAAADEANGFLMKGFDVQLGGAGGMSERFALYQRLADQ